MRTGPFSNSEVIDRLNAYFVPVYVVNEDYDDEGVAPKEERAEVRRIYRETLGKKLSAGTVHVYVLNPQGEVIDSRHVADAADTNALTALLDDITTRLGTAKGEPIVTPKPQSTAPEVAEGSLVLHLVARGLSGRGSWPGTAENWIVYTPAERARLLPANPTVGATSEPDPTLAARLLRHVYPVTENNDVETDEIQEQEFRLTVLSVSEELVRARIDARLVRRHNFYFKDDGNTVEAQLIGYVEWSPKDGKVKAFRLVTDEATYGGGTFAVAIQAE